MGEFIERIEQQKMHVHHSISERKKMKKKQKEKNKS